MSLAIVIMVGALAGAHTSTWGMYKDSAHEGFEWLKYLRSILISALIAPLLVLGFGVPVAGIADGLILFGLTYALERGVSEFYKMFVRVEDQSKYFIPMQLAVRGRVVHDRCTRTLSGIVVVLGSCALLLGLSALQPEAQQRPGWQMFALIGSLSGWFCAVGGAWKDAPIEGFDRIKFLRSPFWTTIYAVLLSNFTDALVIASLAGLGFTVATIETYKKFFSPGTPPGKFAGTPIRFPHMLRRRHRFLPVYIGIWALLILGFAAALAGQRNCAAVACHRTAAAAR